MKRNLKPPSSQPVTRALAKELKGGPIIYPGNAWDLPSKVHDPKPRGCDWMHHPHRMVLAQFNNGTSPVYQPGDCLSAAFH